MGGRGHVGFVVAFSIIPLLGVFTAAILLWNRMVGPADLTVFLIMYVFAALGVSAGYHRLFAHNSFKSGRAVRMLLATGGAVAGQGRR
jgi:stearoyl-CoA desaturase (delta-9 desaturase)